MQFLEERLALREKKGLLRSLKNDEGLIDLTSNDYLGLARKKLGNKCLPRGSTGSRLLTGNCRYYEEVEEKVARYFKADEALIYSSGYAANMGLISSLGRDTDAIFYDLEIHASCHDGMKLSEAACYPFRHNDLDHLEIRLKQSTAQQKFVLVESVYSISGDLAPVKEIADLVKRYGAHLIVDEAHAVGVFQEGLSAVYEPFARVVAFGKAFGVQGGAILGSRTLKEYLVNFSRSFIYSTAPSPSFYAAIESSLEEVEEPRAALLALMAHYGFKTPVKAFFVEEAAALSAFLKEEGIAVRAILPPTAKKPCLRICLHAFNTRDEVDRLWQKKLL